MTRYPVAMIPVELRDRIDAELQPGEKVLWFTQPSPRLAGRGRWVAIPFGLVFAGFAVFWISTSYFIIRGASGGSGGSGIGAFNFFPLFGVPFFVIGILTMLSPLWAARRAGRTAYVITSRRAIVHELSAFGRLKVQSFGPDRLVSMTRTERADGSGDLVFEQFTESVGTGSRTVKRGFMHLENVRPAEQALRDLLLNPKV